MKATRKPCPTAQNLRHWLAQIDAQEIRSSERAYQEACDRVVFQNS